MVRLQLSPNSALPKAAFRNGSALLVQETIDRFKQLKMLPRPLSMSANSELLQLISRLKNEFAGRLEVEKFCLELGRRRFPVANFSVVTAEKKSRCALCDRELIPNERVLYTERIKESICFGCPLDFKDSY